MARRRALALTALTAFSVLALDLFAKALVRSGVEHGERRDLVGGALRLTHVDNEGVAFGRLSGSPVLVALVVGLALVALVVYVGMHLDVPGIWLPTGLLLGGAAGNLVNRIARGHVTDYLELPRWPAFNLADICITVGVILLLVVVERDARRARAGGGHGAAGTG
jgi:signal peptidase II